MQREIKEQIAKDEAEKAEKMKDQFSRFNDADSSKAHSTPYTYGEYPARDPKPKPKGALDAFVQRKPSEKMAIHQKLE